MRALLQDRGSQLAYGLFASTFTFAILALREVDAVGGGTAPGPTVLVAYLVMPASIAALFLYIHHAGNSLRAAGLIDLVGDHLHEQIDRLDPAAGSAPTTRDVVVCPNLESWSTSTAPPWSPPPTTPTACSNWPP